MIQGNLEPNSLNAPTRTMLAVMVETSMSNFKRSKTKYGNAKAAKEPAAVTAKLHCNAKLTPGVQFQPSICVVDSSDSASDAGGEANASCPPDPYAASARIDQLSCTLQRLTSRYRRSRRAPLSPNGMCPPGGEKQDPTRNQKICRGKMGDGTMHEHRQACSASCQDPLHASSETEEVVHAYTNRFSLLQEFRASIYGPASDSNMVLTSKMLPILSNPHGFGSPRPSGEARHTLYGVLGQRNFEEDRASSTSKGSLTTSARLLLVEDMSDRFDQAQGLSKRIGVYVNAVEQATYGLANDDEDDDTPECTGISTRTFTTAAPVPQGRAREDYDETLDSTGESIYPDAAPADPQLISKPQTRNKNRMDSYDLPEPVLPSDDDGAMEDGTSNIRRQLEPSCDQDMIDGQAQGSTHKKRTPAARRKHPANSKSNDIEPLTPGMTEDQARHAYALRNQRMPTAAGRLQPWTPLEEFDSFIRSHGEEPPANLITNPQAPIEHEGEM
jgi:hypothetical protein